jgi:TrkA-C domain
VVGLVLVLAVVLLILLVTRVATVVLALTGMSTESARFQARSALTGVGFTTSEAESVVSHPVRRRVVLVLMLLGSAGVVTALASLVISFGGASSGERVTRGLVLVVGLVLLLGLARSRTFDRLLARVVMRAMRSRGLHVADYAGLLRLSGGFTVGELEVEDGDWLADRTLRELRLRDEGVIVLGVSRGGGEYLGAPGPDTRIAAGDTLVLYGRDERLEELDERRGGRVGDAAHRRAVLPERGPSAADGVS